MTVIDELEGAELRARARLQALEAQQAKPFLIRRAARAVEIIAEVLRGEILKTR